MMVRVYFLAAVLAGALANAQVDSKAAVSGDADRNVPEADLSARREADRNAGGVADRTPSRRVGPANIFAPARTDSGSRSGATSFGVSRQSASQEEEAPKPPRAKPDPKPLSNSNKMGLPTPSVEESHAFSAPPGQGAFGRPATRGITKSRGKSRRSNPSDHRALSKSSEQKTPR